MANRSRATRPEEPACRGLSPTGHPTDRRGCPHRTPAQGGAAPLDPAVEGRLIRLDCGVVPGHPPRGCRPATRAMRTALHASGTSAGTASPSGCLLPTVATHPAPQLKDAQQPRKQCEEQAGDSRDQQRHGDRGPDRPRRGTRRWFCRVFWAMKMISRSSMTPSPTPSLPRRRWCEIRATGPAAASVELLAQESISGGLGVVGHADRYPATATRIEPLPS